MKGFLKGDVIAIDEASAVRLDAGASEHAQSGSDHDANDCKNRHERGGAEAIRRSHAFEAVGRAEEVARLVRFLLTDDSSLILGEEWPSTEDVN